MKIQLLKSFIVCFALSLSFSRCGVVFGGSKIGATVVVKDHPNAQVFVNGKLAEQGKVAGVYSRKNPIFVEVNQEGCEPKKQTFGTTFRTGTFLLNIAWLSPPLVGIAMLIDLTTGACYKPKHKGNPLI